jgi:hypothetical protein
MKKSEIGIIFAWIAIFMCVVIMICLITHNLHYAYSLLNDIRNTQLRVSPAENAKEGFTLFGDASSELAKMNNATIQGTGIAKMRSSVLPIKEFCIKSSYNSAYSGSHIGSDVLKYVLSRGCRYLDLEIYMVDNVAYVGFSTNPSSTHQNITSATTITLNDALTTINIYGFSSPSPNPTDPLFINFRPQSCGIDPVTSGMYKYIAGDIKNTLAPKLSSVKVTGLTPVRDIMNKIVIVMDVTVAPDYKKDKFLLGCVNMESGGTVLRTETYSRMERYNISPPVVDSKNISNVAFLREIHPDQNEATSNPKYYVFVRDYGVQIVANRFYINDVHLKEYESFFSKFNTAFVPFSNAIIYMKDVV